MEYLLMMSLSGSSMMVIYLALRYLIKNRVSARLYYLLIKVAVLYYLIPLPFLKGWYREIFPGMIPERQMRITQISLTWTNYAVHTDEKMYVNVFAVLQVIVAVVWMLVVCVLMARMLIDYARTNRVITRCTDRIMTDRQRVFLAGIKKQYGVKRHVSLSCMHAGSHTMTFGVLRPVIICDKEVESKETRMLICHEMIHIKRWDVLWKIFLQFVVILHWWNPFVWLLQHCFERACECSCDEVVMQGKSKEEVRAYQALLIGEALVQEKMKNSPLRWETGFGVNQNEIRERVENLMKRKKWNRIAAGALVAVLTFANSLTAFAYRDTFHEITPEEYSQTTIEKSLHSDLFSFAPDGITGEQMDEFDPWEESEILYENQFIDEEGNIYPILEEIPGTARGCSHDYVSGTAKKHYKTSDGGCEVTVYRAQRCSKCGTVIAGEILNVITYQVCPH